MTVGCFIYEELYCRYGAPGECVINDSGTDFCNKVCKFLHDTYGVDCRVTTPGNPKSNGLVEDKVGTMKDKMKALMAEKGDITDDRWDEAPFYTALSCLRFDRNCASGFSPTELLLGRKPILPFECDPNDFDPSGTELSMSMVDALQKIRKDNFGEASENISKYQKKYQDQYAKKHKCKPFAFKRGSKVVVLRHRTKRAKSKTGYHWVPHNGFYTILKVDKKRKVCTIAGKNGEPLKKSVYFDRIKPFTR